MNLKRNTLDGFKFIQDCLPTEFKDKVSYDSKLGKINYDEILLGINIDPKKIHKYHDFLLNDDNNSSSNSNKSKHFSMSLNQSSNVSNNNEQKEEKSRIFNALSEENIFSQFHDFDEKIEDFYNNFYN